MTEKASAVSSGVSHKESHARASTEYYTDPLEPEKKGDVDVEADRVSGSSDDEYLDADVLELPKVVREIVPLEDDPTIPVLTFRYFLLSVIFIAPGAFLSTMNSFRTTAAPYSIFFVQIASHWVGKWLAQVLPTRRWKPFGSEKYSFTLNPGPWSIKETALVTITASSGATGSLATDAIALGELFFDQTVSPAAAIFFMWAVVFVGYSYAAIARNFLLYDPQFIWPQALMQTTLFQSFDKADHDSKMGSKQRRVFFFVLLGVTAWEFFPEYIFPMTSSLAFLCWVAPENATANFIGSGLGGMGFLNFTLDWSNITSSIMLYPYWVQIIQFVAFVLGAWVLIPAAKWGNLLSFSYGLMSNSLFTSAGDKYPTADLVTADFKFNQTAYDIHGPVFLGAQRAWNMFFDYASYISGITWVVVFGYGSLKSSLTKFISNRKNLRQAKKDGIKRSINDQYTDRLNKLQTAYEEVPLWWYVTLFGCCFVTLMTIFGTKSLPMPWWACLVGLGIGSVIVTPLAWLYALSNFQLAIGTFNEMLFGYMVQHRSTKSGMSATLYGCIAGDAWYRAQYILQDQKIGHYLHLPPKAVFFSQVFGELIGVPINYGCLKWVLRTKKAFLDGSVEDPLHQWTGQTIVSDHTNAIQYVVLGPLRLFHKYPMLPYGFLLGAVAPLVLYGLYRLFPKSRLHFNLWNTTIFFSTLSNFYGNVSTGYLSSFIGGTVTMFWAYNYKHDLWKKYNYIVGAAGDTGYNLAVLLIFIFFSAAKTVNMPNWWGNNAESVERCFAL